MSTSSNREAIVHPELNNKASQEPKEEVRRRTNKRFRVGEGQKIQKEK